MLTQEELISVMKFKAAIGEPMDNGSCFGVFDPRELRPASMLPLLEKSKEGGDNNGEDDRI